MKIEFFGDSITDMGRDRQHDGTAFKYGTGYVFCIAANLLSRKDNDYQIINRGVSGDRIVSLYERLKPDVWVQKPDVLSILIGINDIWHDIDGMNMGVDIDRYEKVYRMIIEETKQKLPDVKIILMEPFVLNGYATKEQFGEFLAIKKYAKRVKKLADEYGLSFLPLQQKMEEAAEEVGVENVLADGVHPNVVGAKIISDEWLKLFDKIYK